MTERVIATVWLDGERNISQDMLKRRLGALLADDVRDQFSPIRSYKITFEDEKGSSGQ